MVARLHITKGVGCRQCRKQGQVQYLRTYTTNLVHISLRRSEIFFVAFNLSFILWLHTTRTYFAGCTRDPSRALAATRLRLKNPNLKPTATITKSMARIIGPNAASFIAECSNWVRHYCPLNSRYKFMRSHYTRHGHVKIITFCTFSIMHSFMYIYIDFMLGMFYLN